MQQYGSLIFIVVIIAVMYFMMIRPQKKRQQQHQQTLQQLKKGDKVVTIGRLHGVVDAIDRDNKKVTLDCSGVYLEFDLNAIASVEDQAMSTDDSQKSAAKSTDNQASTTDDDQKDDSKTEK